MRLLSESPANSPGNTRECDQITRGPPAPSWTFTSSLSVSVPQIRVLTRIGTEIAPCAPSRAEPITAKLVSVAVCAAAW